MLTINISFFVGLLILAVFPPILECRPTTPTKSQSVEFADGAYILKDGIDPNSVAWGKFTNEINQTGWATLELYTSRNYTNDQQAYAAGFLEGSMTRGLITDHWHNTFKSYCQQKPLFCKKLQDFIQGNTEFVKEQLNLDPETSYIEQVKLFYYQYSGLKDGYRGKSGQPRIETDMELFLLQISGDIESLEASLGAEAPRLVAGRCSALIKVLPGNKDLYIAQDTWSGYNTMLRVLKKYSFEFYTNSSRKEIVPGKAMSFSSYPGVIYSGDDFYVISSGLVTLETTIGNSNPKLYPYQGQVTSFLEGVRNMVSNRLAVYGYNWVEFFTLSNSGTYNNQWMVIDYKLFKKGKPLQEGLFWIAEQIPAVAQYQELSHILESQSYWPSYNLPYSPYIYNMSGVNESAKIYGDWFSYTGNPRAKIFKRDHVKVKDIDSMMKVMRYNNYRKDPLSRCNCTPPYSGENAISARSDLNPANGSYPFGALGHRLHGGIDMKLTTMDLASTLDFVAVSSPTYDDLPPFQWSKSDWKDTPHQGQPDVWDFKPIQTKWSKN